MRAASLWLAGAVLVWVGHGLAPIAPTISAMIMTVGIALGLLGVAAAVFGE